MLRLANKLRNSPELEVPHATATRSTRPRTRRRLKKLSRACLGSWSEEFRPGSAAPPRGGSCGILGTPSRTPGIPCKLAIGSAISPERKRRRMTEIHSLFHQLREVGKGFPCLVSQSRNWTFASSIFVLTCNFVIPTSSSKYTINRLDVVIHTALTSAPRHGGCPNEQNQPQGKD